MAQRLSWGDTGKGPTFTPQRLVRSSVARKGMFARIEGLRSQAIVSQEGGNNLQISAFINYRAREIGIQATHCISYNDMYMRSGSTEVVQLSNQVCGV